MKSEELKIRRLTNQHLLAPADKISVVRDLCGVQVQFFPNAVHYQLMLAYQKKESIFLPQEHLRGIFNLAGIVMPPILLYGRVVGKWKRKNRSLTFTMFESLSPTDKRTIRNTAEETFGEVSEIKFE